MNKRIRAHERMVVYITGMFMDITSATSVLTRWDFVMIVIGIIYTIGCAVYMTTDVWTYITVE